MVGFDSLGLTLVVLGIHGLMGFIGFGLCGENDWLVLYGIDLKLLWDFLITHVLHVEIYTEVELEKYTQRFSDHEDTQHIYRISFPNYISSWKREC
jgi:hypothetical protein